MAQCDHICDHEKFIYLWSSVNNICFHLWSSVRISVFIYQRKQCEQYLFSSICEAVWEYLYSSIRRSSVNSICFLELLKEAYNCTASSTGTKSTWNTYSAIHSAIQIDSAVVFIYPSSYPDQSYTVEFRKGIFSKISLIFS